MRFTLTLPDILPVQQRVELARRYLEALVYANRVIIRAGLVPPLNQTATRYAMEPPSPDEEFADAFTCYQRGWGDCDDLAAWWCAELQERGIPATLVFKANEFVPNKRRLIHCMVRLPNGRIDDPSKTLVSKGRRQWHSPL